MICFRFRKGKRVKFTMSARPEPLQVSSWARPPGQQKHPEKKSDPPMRGDPRGIPGMIGRDTYIIDNGKTAIALYTKLQVYVTSMYMNGNLWGEMWSLGVSPIIHLSTLLEDWVSSAPVFYESPITTYLSFEGSAHLCYSRILLLSIWKGTRLPQMHDPLNSKCHVLTFLP